MKQEEPQKERSEVSKEKKNKGYKIKSIDSRFKVMSQNISTMDDLLKEKIVTRGKKETIADQQSQFAKSDGSET